jgi:hypothetical protein
MNKDELIEKLADTITEDADMDSLMSYFHEGQIGNYKRLLCGCSMRRT